MDVTKNMIELFKGSQLDLIGFLKRLTDYMDKDEKETYGLDVESFASEAEIIFKAIKSEDPSLTEDEICASFIMAVDALCNGRRSIWSYGFLHTAYNLLLRQFASPECRKIIAMLKKSKTKPKPEPKPKPKPSDQHQT